MAEHFWYDRDGNPLPDDYAKIEELLKDYDYKMVDKTHIGDVTVSTVWLGLDHQFGDGPPLIFETMIFGGEYDGDCYRYPTEEAAAQDHELSVIKLLEEQKKELLKVTGKATIKIPDGIPDI